MTRGIDPWMANEILHVLIEECGVRRSDVHQRQGTATISGWTGHYSFITYLELGLAFGHEYRFMGALGFGGKFYNDGRRWWVSCYREHETPERLAMITRANERLAALQAVYLG